MTTDRQTLRKKHTPTIGFVGWSESEHRFTEGMVCDKCSEFDGQSKWGEWPCDVIKVLDATEPDPDCDHSIGKVLVLAKGVTLNQADVKYCPKCGVKL